MEPTIQQQQALDKIWGFLNNSSKNVFILRGYAGTGKTTLVKLLSERLVKDGISFMLMAPTGRSAKVLSEKTGILATTVHRSIFSPELECIEVKNTDMSKKSYKYVFPVLIPEQHVRLLVIDESSMIPNMETKNEFYEFGSGRLLEDILEFRRNNGQDYCKILFVGDAAQLPPVGDPVSRALSKECLENLNNSDCSVEEFEMDEVLRQKADSPVLKLATDVRDILRIPQKERSVFSIVPDGKTIVEVENSDLARVYIRKNPHPDIKNDIIIAYSNRRCSALNAEIREAYFGESAKLKVGDVLIVNRNNYGTFGARFYNGETVIVRSLEDKIEERKVTVSKNEKENVEVVLRFRNITVYHPSYNYEYQCIILENGLEYSGGDDYLTSKEISEQEVLVNKALYIDFCIRNRYANKYVEGSPEFKTALCQDRYFNALHVRYGYAVTCHKAQGGEWENVFIDFSNRCGLSDDALRWCYTAITRGKTSVYVASYPHITGLNKLHFNAIEKYGKVPKDFFPADIDVDCPFGFNSYPAIVKLQRRAVVEDFDSSEFRVKNLKPSNYLDEYTFECGNESEIKIRVHYTGGGLYNKIDRDSASSDSEKTIIDKINAVKPVYPAPVCCPSTDILQELYQLMTSACSECGISIVNVIEHISQYKVIYHLVTSARFATVTFYVKGSGAVSTAMLQSELGASDCKLQELVKIMDNL